MAGRKNKYYTHVEPNLKFIEGFLSSGHTEESVAKRFGVGVSTWERYKNEHDELRQVIHRSGMNATALVVNSLFKRANGYQYEEIHTKIIDSGQQRQGQGQGSQRRIIKKITKEVPPDTAAAIFWITNRDPENWKNTQNIKHSGEIKNSGVLMTSPPMDKDEWLQFYKENVEQRQEHQGQAEKENQK